MRASDESFPNLIWGLGTFFLKSDENIVKENNERKT